MGLAKIIAYCTIESLTASGFQALVMGQTSDNDPDTSLSWLSSQPHLERGRALPIYGILSCRQGSAAKLAAQRLYPLFSTFQ